MVLGNAQLVIAHGNPICSAQVLASSGICCNIAANESLGISMTSGVNSPPIKLSVWYGIILLMMLAMGANATLGVEVIQSVTCCIEYVTYLNIVFFLQQTSPILPPIYPRRNYHTPATTDTTTSHDNSIVRDDSTTTSGFLTAKGYNGYRRRNEPSYSFPRSFSNNGSHYNNINATDCYDCESVSDKAETRRNPFWTRPLKTMAVLVAVFMTIAFGLGFGLSRTSPVHVAAAENSTAAVAAVATSSAAVTEVEVAPYKAVTFTATSGSTRGVAVTRTVAAVSVTVTKSVDGSSEISASTTGNGGGSERITVDNVWSVVETEDGYATTIDSVD
ncbi:hypothetical protein HK100_006380 [Physocladia obscura]|uniref:Uncharacterized protein n=1 Tax=Physocladia obscura TaxID=109957 RepID=A0AAD5ST93_9FUNG|nr:hypothetical protein HK100_006380 [Physocladia obscura]